MAGAKVPLTFRIFKGDQLVREERLSLSVIKLGKVPSAHLKLEDETVSRMHAIIEVNGPGDVSIIDLGSTKGTFVNGQKVNKAKLQSGDMIVVGETRIELAIGAGDDALDERTVAAPASYPPPDLIGSLPKPAAPAPAPTPLPAPAPQTFTPPAPPRPAPPPLAVPPPLSGPVTAPLSVSAPPPVSAAMAAAPPIAPPPAVAPPRPAFNMPAPAGFPGSQPIGFGSPLVAAPASPNAFATAMAHDAEVAGAHCVEVVATLGDSVVAAKHSIDVRGGQLSVLTIVLWLFALASFTMLVVGFTLFAINATDQDVARHYWTEQLHKPLWGFREHEVGIGWAIDAYNTMWFTVVTAFIALWRTHGELARPTFVLGRGRPEISFLAILTLVLYFLVPGAIGFAFGGLIWALVTIGLMAVGLGLRCLFLGRFPSMTKWELSDVPVEMVQDEFAIVAPTPGGNEFAFHMLPEMEGEVIVNGQSTSFADLRTQGRSTLSPIPHGATIRARFQRNNFVIRSVPQPRNFFWGLWSLLWAWVWYQVLSVAAVVVELLFVLLMYIGSLDQSSVGVDLASLEDLNTRSASNANDDPPPPPEEDKPDDGKEESGGTGTAMALDDGKMGKKDSDRAEGQYKMKNENVDPQLARQQAIEQARNAGILGSTALQQGGAFASLTGTGDISSGFDDSNIYGGLLGNEAGEMNGGFGYGRSGFGPGGGGTGWGTIGTGRYGTIGHGNGTGNGYGVGGGRGGMRGRTAAVPTVSIGQPSANGDLDKAIIRRYIKRNIQKITYCYEKQLLAKPGLAGTVQTSFFITPNGTVQNAGGQGVDPEVASCVAGVISGIEFPKPKGGGGVQVNYPFTFRPAGS